MAIGIFGGTFDPIHFGHLRVAEEIREDFSLEKVYFVPAHIPAHKRGRMIADGDERLHMARAAVKGNSFFTVSGMEMKRGGVSYTIDTLKRFGKHHKDLYFLIGVDAFAEIETWHHYGELFSRANFVVMTRPWARQVVLSEMFPENIKSELAQIDENTYEHQSGKKVFLRKITQMDISSTKIKESVSKGRSIRYLVPAPVEKIIAERGLYKL